MSEHSRSSNSRKSTGSPISRDKFTSNKQHIQFADQVLKKDIDVQFSQKFLGSWQNSTYDTKRFYVSSQTTNVKLYTTTLTPHNPKAVLIILHGLGEHQGRFISIADHFANHDYQVILYDQRGHGKSGGLRGHTSIQQMHQDFDSVLQIANPLLPIFCYGHDLGAAIVVSFCALNKQVNFQGIITSGGRFSNPFNPIKVMLLRLLKEFMPNLLVNLYPDYTATSKNNYHIKKIAEDPLVQSFITVRTAYEICKLIDFVRTAAPKISTPMLLVHGKQDRITSHMGSVEFYGKLNGDRILKIFEYGFHDLHCDTEKDRFQSLIFNWCQKQMESTNKKANLSNLKHGFTTSKPMLNKVAIVLLVLLITRLKCMNLLGRTMSRKLASIIINH